MLSMLGSVHSIVFFVADVDEVAAWYCRLLGFPPELLCFHEADAKCGDVSGRQVCYWTVADIDDAIQRFEAQGGSLFRSPIVVEEGARICQVRDPFGCVHGFAQRA